MTAINDRLRALRMAIGISRLQFAERASIHPSTYGYLEDGKRVVLENHIEKIVRLTQVNEEWLRTGKGEMYDSEEKKEEMIKSIRTVKPVSRLSEEEQRMAERVVMVRNQTGLDQLGFAEAIGVSRPNVCLVEQAKQPMTTKFMNALKYAFNVNEEWLRTGEGEMYITERPEDELLSIFKSLSVSYKEFLLATARNVASLVSAEKEKIHSIPDSH